MKKKSLFFNIALSIGVINICNNLQTIPPAPPPPPAPKPPIIARPIVPPTLPKAPIAPAAPGAKSAIVTAPAAATSTQKPTLIKYNVSEISITNLSSQNLSVTNVTIGLGSKNFPIKLKNPVIIKSKNKGYLNNLSINIPSDNSTSSTGLTSLSANGVSLNVPATFNGFDIYINNINSTWQVVPEPDNTTKNTPKDKKTGPKTSNTKLVGTTVINKNKTPNKIALKKSAPAPKK